MMGDPCGGHFSWHTRHTRSFKARSLFQRQALREAGGSLETSMSSAMNDESLSTLSSSIFFPSRIASSRGKDRVDDPGRLAHLTSSFALHEAEVAFFDTVISVLPLESTSFAELKSAYNACRDDIQLMRPVMQSLRASHTDEAQASMDARLWNTLLSLVQVRGTTWAERWDSIRVSLGLEPLDEQEASMSMTAIHEALTSPPHPGIRSSLSEPNSDSFARPVSSTPKESKYQRYLFPTLTLSAPFSSSIPSSSTSSSSKLERRWHIWCRRTQRQLFYFWLDRVNILRQMDASATQARAQVCLLSYWAHWCHRSEQCRLAESSAIAWSDYATLARHWCRWVEVRNKKYQVRRETQHRALQLAWSSWDATRCDRLQRVAWSLWRQAYLFRAANAFDAYQAVRHMWKTWRLRFDRMRQLAKKGDVLGSYMAAGLLSRVWLAWRFRLSERRIDAHNMTLAVRMEEKHTMQSAWLLWRQLCLRRQVRVTGRTGFEALTTLCRDMIVYA